MKNIRYRYYWLLAVFFIYLPTSGLANENYSGSWHMTAGNTRYLLELTQRGDRVFGNLLPVNDNRSQPIIAYGEVYGRQISINAHKKDFSLIYKFQGAMIGKKNGQAIKGTVTINNKNMLDFYGVKYP